MECLVGSKSECTLNTVAKCIRPLEVLKSLDNNHPLHIHAIVDGVKGFWQVSIIVTQEESKCSLKIHLSRAEYKF